MIIQEFILKFTVSFIKTIPIHLDIEVCYFSSLQWLFFVRTVNIWLLYKLTNSVLIFFKDYNYKILLHQIAFSYSSYFGAPSFRPESFRPRRILSTRHFVQ